MRQTGSPLSMMGPLIPEQLATWKSYEVKRFDLDAFKLAKREVYETFRSVTLERKLKLR